MLRELEDYADERLLVGPETMDDAGVVVLGEAEGVPGGARVGLVQTVDFFPPVVDDPYLYGAVAAANSLSDVYAMGGRPLSALTLASFPKDFRPEWIAQILRGGFEKVHEAGAVVAGGHTVESEVQFGFSVTGLVDPERVATNSGAEPGDVLYLTKPVGMGSMTTAAKRAVIDWDTMLPAAEQMAQLNAAAAEAMGAVGVKACTDVTGFGLMGHARNIAASSQVRIALRAEALPVFPGALDLAREGVVSGGSKRGRAALGETVRVGADVEEALGMLCYDAETSGGLLIVVAAGRTAALETALRARDVLVCRVGEVLEPADGVFVELV